MEPKNTRYNTYIRVSSSVCFFLNTHSTHTKQPTFIRIRTPNQRIECYYIILCMSTNIGKPPKPDQKNKSREEEKNDRELVSVHKYTYLCTHTLTHSAQSRLLLYLYLYLVCRSVSFGCSSLLRCHSSLSFSSSSLFFKPWQWFFSSSSSSSLSLLIVWFKNPGRYMFPYAQSVCTCVWQDFGYF